MELFGHVIDGVERGSQAVVMAIKRPEFDRQWAGAALAGP
jgi:hypothetical protein